MVESEDDMTATPVIQWGILGAGMIARTAIMPAFADLSLASVVAVAGHDSVRLQKFAQDFQIPLVYDSYAALLEDPEIDAVYIALPNSMHYEWTIRALQAGKDVLCEKPLAMTAEEATEMQRIADESDVWLMEAVMYRFHPRIRAINDIIRAGTIGQVTLVRGSFCFTMSDESNYRNDPNLGGGALMDVGSYCINAARYVIGEEPETVFANATFNDAGIDVSVSGVLNFPSGALAHIQCSFGSAEHQSLDIIGTLGTIEIPTPFTAWNGDESTIRITTGADFEEMIFASANPYTLMLDHFSECVRGDAEPFLPAEDGIGTMRTIDAIMRSIASEHVERVLESL